VTVISPINPLKISSCGPIMWQDKALVHERGDRLKRLSLVLLWSIAFGSAASAQPTPERTYRVGVISISASSIELFRRFSVPELAKRGFVEGRNLTLETRFGEPHDIPELARDLVGTKPDVVVAVSSPVIRAVASASSHIPIVAAFFGTDPDKGL
jgi:putative tryptophan/tyrosine transport system substrate-binding protein